MTIETRAEADAMARRMAQHRFLAGLSYPHMALRADCALTSHFKAGEIIFREASQPTGLFNLDFQWCAGRSATKGDLL